MKSIFITICFLILVSISFGQKTKTVDIWRKPNAETLYAHYNYNEMDSLTSINIQLLGQNSKYKHITDFITIYIGSPYSFYKFLNEVEKFCIENEGRTSTQINGQSVIVINSMGVKGVCISDSKDLGYRSFSLKALNKFKSKFVDWCKKNNVAYE